MKRKQATQNDLINWWLEKYHNTNTEKVLKDHPEWDVESKEWDSRTFYDTYPCTQEQHDEWYDWAIETVMKDYGIRSKKYAERSFAFTYLNVSPKIIWK
jgi:hypothetical protein